MSTPFESFLGIAQSGHAFTAVGGRAFITLPARFPGHVTLAVRSRAFRQWFFDRCYSACDSIPSAQSFAAILHHLEARAARDPENCNIHVPFRVDSRGHGPIPKKSSSTSPTLTANIVEITAHGWQTTSGLGVPFETSPATWSLPTPEPPGDHKPLDTLRTTLNLGPPNGPDWLRCLAWLLAALHPAGPYPILILRGPSGAGKSFAARTLRSLVDPSASPFTPFPSSARELLTFTRHNWVLAFDHVSTLSPRIAAALCRLSSGAGVACREPGNPETLQLWTKRPILLTAAEDWLPPADLAARALTVTLPPLSPETRRPEHELLAVINQAFPEFLGALCDAVSRALAGPPAAGPSPGRNADALAWAQAAAPACNATPAEFRDAFHSPPPTDPFVHAVRAALHTTPRLTGTAADLHQILPVTRSPRALSAKIHDSLLPLAESGIEVQFRFRHGGVKVIDLFATPDFLQLNQSGVTKELTHEPQVPLT